MLNRPAQPVGPGIPSRAHAATLRNSLGRMMGRFGLHESEDGRTHRWEWFDGRWPDGDFYMAPDDLEPVPTASLCRQFALPAVIQPVMTADFEPRRGARIYEVTRVDGLHRRLATLVVARGELRWLEVDHGAPLELMPGWLWFRRCDEVRGAFSRRLRQVAVDTRGRRVSREPGDLGSVDLPDEPEVLVGARTGFAAAWAR